MIRCFFTSEECIYYNNQSTDPKDWATAFYLWLHNVLVESDLALYYVNHGHTSQFFYVLFRPGCESTDTASQLAVSWFPHVHFTYRVNDKGFLLLGRPRTKEIPSKPIYEDVVMVSFTFEPCLNFQLPTSYFVAKSTAQNIKLYLELKCSFKADSLGFFSHETQEFTTMSEEGKTLVDYPEHIKIVRGNIQYMVIRVLHSENTPCGWCFMPLAFPTGYYADGNVFCEDCYLKIK